MGGVRPAGGMGALERRLELLEREVAAAGDRLLEIEGSRIMRSLRIPGEWLRDWRGRLGHRLLRSPLHPLYLKLVRHRAADEAYRLWAQCDQAVETRTAGSGPLISILMPLRDPRREWLVEAVESVFRQTWPRWQLCVCDDASREAWVEAYFTGLCAREARVQFVRSAVRLGDAGAANRAGELAAGDYVGFLDQNDLLAPAALEAVAEALRDGPAELLYSDEDRLDERGRRMQPVFKPAWSPDLLLSCMYVGRFLVVRRAALDRAGWLRSALDGAQDYDLVLRLAENGGEVRHIPRVLYHRRREPEWAEARSHAAGRRALSEAIVRRGWAAEIEDGPAPNTYRLRRTLRERPLASLVICSRNGRLLSRCLRAIERRTGYGRREIVVVDHLVGKDHGVAAAARRYGCKRVCYSGPFDFAGMCNLGAREAAGGVLVFLNDDVAPLEPGWLEALVAQAERPEVGVVGARLLYPHGDIQHAGLVIGIMNGVGHPQRHTFGAGYWHWWPLARNVSAVTGACLAIRKAVFEELGGFDPVFPGNYNDADLCLRAIRAGYRVVYEPQATLSHQECRTRRPGVHIAERSRWAERWGAWLERGDPYYSPNLTDRSEAAALHPQPAAARRRPR